MATKRTSPAKEKVLDAACNLFYSQGYHATTVDQIIELSGVSKPTVYSHFSTKEDLCVAYLREARQREIEILKDRLREATSPEEKFVLIMRNTADRMRDTKYRGCPFFNMVSELVDHENPVLKEAKRFVDGYNEVIVDTVKELKASDKRRSDIDVEKISRSYYLIVCGAIMACQEYQEAWPLDHAVDQVKGLLEMS